MASSSSSIFIDFTANYITTISELKYIVTNNGYNNIKVVTGGRANFNRDFNKNT